MSNENYRVVAQAMLGIANNLREVMPLISNQLYQLGGAIVAEVDDQIRTQQAEILSGAGPVCKVLNAIRLSEGRFTERYEYRPPGYTHNGAEDSALNQLPLNAKALITHLLWLERAGEGPEYPITTPLGKIEATGAGLLLTIPHLNTGPVPYYTTTFTVTYYGVKDVRINAHLESVELKIPELALGAEFLKDFFEGVFRQEGIHLPKLVQCEEILTALQALDAENPPTGYENQPVVLEFQRDQQFEYLRLEYTLMPGSDLPWLKFNASNKGVLPFNPVELHDSLPAGLTQEVLRLLPSAHLQRRLKHTATV